MSKQIYYFRPSPLEKLLRGFAGGYRVKGVERAEPPAVWELPAVLVADLGADDPAFVAKVTPANESFRVVYLFKGAQPPLKRFDKNVFAVLPKPVTRPVLRKTISSIFDSYSWLQEREQTREEMTRMTSELGTLNRIGLALSTERNTDLLLELILSKSREITNADAGSLYLVEDEPGGGKHLLFKLTQGDSHSVPFREFTMPIDTKSLAGYAATKGEVLNIKDAYRIRNRPFRLNREFDQKFGYRTKSMLVVPMKNQKDEVIGVLQLINAKRDRAVKLTSRKVVNEVVIPFSQRSQELAISLAGQAGVALENNLLYRDIQRLFEGFVKASVTAIESRDPTTFGHSERVAELTVGLAQAVDRSDSEAYKDIRFTRQDIQELRYASILHDFGKVGVREEVLVKAKKLYPSQFELINKRFAYIRKAIEAENYRRKLNFVLQHGNSNCEKFLEEMDQEQKRQLAELDEFMRHIQQANEPTVLPEKTSEKLNEILGWTFEDPSGPSEPLLTPEEFRFLTIPKGSLDPEERVQIESHVIHSFRFLSQIPWTKELRNIPDIARAHHEKLDGSGYPYHMKADEIPFQSKMMTISDIFDALTARDRPYKKAVSLDRALDIIGQEVKSQLLDPQLFRIFVDAKVFQLTAKE